MQTSCTETPNWLRIANAEGLLKSTILELEATRLDLEITRLELAHAQTLERRACAELCREVVAAYSAEGHELEGFGALRCVDVLLGKTP